MRVTMLVAVAATLCGPPVQAQATSGAHAHAMHPESDSSFAALQRRGKAAMGVDQYTSVHHFDTLPDGGRIELIRESDDSAGIAQIRAHIHAIAQAFKSGDFSTPAFVHMRAVPGTAAMVAKRAVIAYEPHDLPRGAELRIRTTDADALRAIHAFLAFQRSDHHAGGTVDTGGAVTTRR